MAKRAPRRRVYHRNWRWAHVQNSRQGSKRARAKGCGWIDNDGQRSIDFEWANEHGAPSRFWFPKGDSAKDHEADELLKRSRVVGRIAYPLRSALDAFRDNAEFGIDTEWEVKGLRPITDEQLDAMFADLAADAEAAYGPEWRKHVTVKVLTNLRGGVRYALRICRDAHGRGFRTMILARGKARFRRFRAHPEVTWVRGSLRRLP